MRSAYHVRLQLHARCDVPVWQGTRPATRPIATCRPLYCENLRAAVLRTSLAASSMADALSFAPFMGIRSSCVAAGLAILCDFVCFGVRFVSIPLLPAAGHSQATSHLVSLLNSGPQCLLAVGLLKNGGASPADAGAGSLAASCSEFVAGSSRGAMPSIACWSGTDARHFLGAPRYPAGRGHL